MSTTSWTINSTKRKPKMAMQPPRKRQRLSDMRDNTRPSKSQKTLTQAQWMTPPSNQLANDELLLEEKIRPRTLPRANPRRRLKKRDSTLTQMDFFDSLPLDQEDIDDHLLPQVDIPDDNHVAIPQLDGAYSSPRKPRPQKASVDLKQLREGKANLESQEYKPSTRKRTIQHMEKEALSSGRRTSRRLASKQLVFSDPAQSSEYFNEALASPSRRIAPEMEAETFVPRLETKYSLQEKEEEEVQTEILLSKDSLVHLHTPTKGCTIILSSQSPESLPPSTRKRVRAESPTFESERRTPLAECSINSWQVSPTKSSSKKHRKLPSSQPSSPAKKLVVLKLAKRLEARKVPQIEDSQKNIWSIPSSSPLQQRHESMLSVRQPEPTTGDETDEAEIPATSQAQNVTSSPAAKSTQDSLPSVVDLVERRPLLNRDDTSYSDKAIRPQYAVHTGAIVHELEPAPKATVTSGMTELEEPHSGAVLLHSETLLDAPKNEEPMLVEDSEEESIVSPVKLLSNKLSHDGSSTPIPKRWEESGGSRTISISPFDHGVNDPSSPDPEQPMNEPRTPLPLPQLISQSATPRHLTNPSLPKDTDEVQLPRPPFLHRSSTHVSTTLIPLNDIESAPSSSSLASTKAITQKAVNPASMPHPSQISTQDATQGFLNMSSFPRPFHDSYDEENFDKITIKDSSSCQVSMSQLPQHVSTTQSQPNIDLGLDEIFNSDEDGDLDLDPPSTASHHDHHAMSDIQIERTPPAKRTVDALQQETVGGANVIHADHNEDAPQVMGQTPDQTRGDSPIPSSQQSISIPSSPNPPPLQRKYDPIPGFDNDTQSNFTQNGHVTAAYIHRQREAGVLPEWYTPEPFQVPGYTRRK
jgi:hypothetical protein